MIWYPPLQVSLGSHPWKDNFRGSHWRLDSFQGPLAFLCLRDEKETPGNEVSGLINNQPRSSRILGQFQSGGGFSRLTYRASLILTSECPGYFWWKLQLSSLIFTNAEGCGEKEISGLINNQPRSSRILGQFQSGGGFSRLTYRASLILTSECPGYFWWKLQLSSLIFTNAEGCGEKEICTKGVSAC